MTRQEIFDKVVAHFATQRVQAVSAEGCRYRTKEGLKCAVGALIPDSIYKEDFEEKRIRKLLELYPKSLEDAGLHADDTAFLIDLQDAHDSCPAFDFLSNLTKKLTSIAAVYKLNPASLESLEAAATVEKTEVVE